MFPRAALSCILKGPFFQGLYVWVGPFQPLSSIPPLWYIWFKDISLFVWASQVVLVIVGKIAWRRAWRATSVFLPGESHGQRSLVGYSPKCRKESDRTLSLSKHCNSNQGHLEMASKKVTEFVILCAPLTLIYTHRDNFLSFLFIAQMIGPIISAVGNLTPCFYFFVLCALS